MAIDLSFLTGTVESRLAQVLDPALNATSTADTVAQSLDGLYDAQQPPAAKDTESLFWSLWSAYIQVAKRVPADDEQRQALLVTAVEKLRARQKGSVKVWSQDSAVWSDLPLLGPCMREAWNDTPRFDGSEQDNARITSWINLNSFVARLVGASITPSWDNFAIWALRDALENDISSPSARDVHVAVASEWALHAGQVLRAKCNSPEALDDTQKRTLKPGKLFTGESGFSSARWQFWLERLEALGKETGNSDLQGKANKAVATMKA